MEQNVKDTALLVMDMQVGVLAMLNNSSSIISEVAKAITTARKNKIPVIYVVVGFRAGAPEISLNNKSFGAGKEKYGAMNMDEFIKVHPDLAPTADDIIVLKRRTSAFTGSDLEVVLRGMGIQHIVLSGIATSGVVLSTVREAADKDYRITILSDCCADNDEEVHKVLTTKIFVRQANVISLGEWDKSFMV